MTDKAYCSVVLALLQVTFLGKFGDKGLGPGGWPFSCLPDLVADCHDSSDYYNKELETHSTGENAQTSSIQASLCKQLTCIQCKWFIASVLFCFRTVQKCK